jgi:hypothetical protein
MIKMVSLVSCESCGKSVPDYSLNRDGECSFCRAEDRAGEMTVGDLGGK